MELVTHPNDLQFAEMNAGTASDHFQMATSHFRRSLYLFFCRGGGDVGGVTYQPTPLKPDAIATDAMAAEGGPRNHSVFLPTDPWKEAWDLWVLMLILYSAVMVPYRICFDSPAEDMMFIFEQTVTVTFIIDVCFNFNTAYMEGDMWVIDRGLIANNYFGGWIWIDVPSSLPIELIDSMLEGDSKALGYLRFLRLFRLLRLLRLLKVGEYIAALEIRFDLNLTFLRIIQMVLALLFLAHILGCFWFYMAALVGIDPEIPTWVSSYDGGSALDAGAPVQYLYALYWALTTLTTVGYGDITPANNVERIYSLFALLTGALIFGYMLSSIGSLVAAIDRQAALSEEKMDEVKEYMRWRKLPRDLVSRLRRYYNYYYSRKTAFDESAILGDLTPALRFEVVQAALKDTIGRIPLFTTTLDPLFQMEVFPLFKPINASPNETIFNKGDLSLALFFLLKGQIEVISGVDGRVLYRCSSGQHFGESVLTGRRRSGTHKAATSCEMFAISAEDLSDLFSRRPREGRIILEAVMTEHKRKEHLRALSLRLLINRLKETKPLDAAALKLQLAWNKRCDEKVYRETNTDDLGMSASKAESEEPIPTSPFARGHTQAAIEKPSPSVPKPSTKRLSAGHFSSSDLQALVSRLDKVDDLMSRLETMVGSGKPPSYRVQLNKKLGGNYGGLSPKSNQGREMSA